MSFFKSENIACSVPYLCSIPYAIPFRVPFHIPFHSVFRSVSIPYSVPFRVPFHVPFRVLVMGPPIVHEFFFMISRLIFKPPVEPA